MHHFRPYHLTETDSANETDRDFMTAQIKQFNSRASAHHLYLRTHPSEPLDLFLRDDTEAIVAV